MTDKATKERIGWLDAVRVLAISCVLLTHAISYAGVMDKDPTTFMWTVYLVLRFIAITGVPLFLMLSGYLCIGKKLTASYYAGIIPVVLSYLVITAISIAAAHFSGEASFTVFKAILGTLNFTAHGYAWYVEMYIGLFLLIPFLNILWNALGTRKRKLALIGVLALMTVLPSTVPSFHLFGTKLDVLPDYWTDIYPLTFYFIGAYLKEYPIRLTAWQKAVFAVAATALPVTLCLVKTRMDGEYAWYMMNGFSSVTVALTGIAYFTALSDVKMPRAVSFAMKHISLCSFEMYLFSYVTDHIMQKLIADIGMTHDSVIILVSFVGSFVMAFAASFILRLALVPLAEAIMNIFLQKKEKTPA